MDPDPRGRRRGGSSSGPGTADDDACIQVAASATTSAAATQRRSGRRLRHRRPVRAEHAPRAATGSSSETSARPARASVPHPEPVRRRRARPRGARAMGHRASARARACRATRASRWRTSRSPTTTTRRAAIPASVDISVRPILASNVVLMELILALLERERQQTALRVRRRPMDSCTRPPRRSVRPRHRSSARATSPASSSRRPSSTSRPTTSLERLRRHNRHAARLGRRLRRAGLPRRRRRRGLRRPALEGDDRAPAHAIDGHGNELAIDCERVVDLRVGGVVRRRAATRRAS